MELQGGLIGQKTFHKKQEPLHTYSLTFTNEEPEFETDFLRRDRDDPWAQRVAEHIGTEHRSIEVGIDARIEHLLMPMRARDLPGSGEIETSFYLLFKEMKQDATVALSGESADEIFSGYPWFHQEKVLEAQQFPWRLHHSYIATILSKELKEHIHLERYQKQKFQEAVRYEGDHGEIDLELNDTVNRGQAPYMGKLATLLKWHEQDPVDTFETRRNDMIYSKYQHNRNPFIDHPEWVQSIGK